MLNEALAGVRVLDFSQVAAGPLCSLLLAQMGAEVTKVEPPGGDLGRILGPAWVGETSALFHALNHSKQGICLDLKSPEGVAVARKLAAGADIVLESMRPGVMEKLGLGPRQLCHEDPKLIYCSISAYGQSGPYASRAGVDGILQADSGLMSIIGVPEAEPCKVQTPVVDVITGHIACSAIVSKLVQRGRDGKGGHLDVNLFNSAIALQLPSLASYLRDGKLPQRIGSAAPYSAPNEAFETADGWIMVAAYMSGRWDRLCELLDRADLYNDPRFSSSASRIANRTQMRMALQAEFRKRSTGEWLEALRRADILCAKVANYEEVAGHPQLKSNGIMLGIDVPGHGSLRVPGFAVNSREMNQCAPRAAPALGQDTWLVLQSCGFAETEIERLAATGTIRALSA